MNFKKYHVSKNVMPAGELKTVESNGVTFSSDGKGKYSISGTATAYASARFNLLSAFTTPISVSNGGQGTLSFFNTQSDNNVTFVFYNGTTKVDDWKQTPSNRASTAYNAVGNKYVNSIVITVNSGATVDMTITPEFTNDGILPTEFEPYSSEVWHDTPHYIHNTSTDTITTLPAMLYPNAVTATVGLKGNMSQTGTPTPDNPVMPEGCGERTGNLFDVEMEQGSISASGVNQSSLARIRTPDFILLEAGNYVINASASNDLDCFVFIYNMSGTFVERVPSEWTTLPYAFTLSENCKIKVVLAYKPAASVFPIVPSDVSDITLNSGSTALPYEPWGIKIPILSANTTTPVYLGQVESTRKIKKLVLTGDETLTSGSVIGQIRTPLTGAINSLGLCTHYIIKTSYGGAFPYFRIANNVLWFELPPDGYETKEEALADFKAYLAQQYAAGTPVTIWYVLAEPETGIVNEPLMRIGDYADEVSGITIPTIAGADTLSVDTTLQPSEVTVNYKGWHPVQSVHEYNSNYTIATMQALTIAQLQTHTISELQGGEWS